MNSELLNIPPAPGMVTLVTKGLPYRAEAAFPTGSTLWELASTDVDDPNHAAPRFWEFCEWSWLWDF